MELPRVQVTAGVGLDKLLPGEISKLGHSESPAVTLGVVLLNLGQVVLEVAEPDLLFLQAGVTLPMERLELCELLRGV